MCLLFSCNYWTCKQSYLIHYIQSKVTRHFSTYVMEICDQHKFVVITSQSRCLLKYLCCCRCYYENPKDCFSKIIDTDAAVAATAICQWIYSMRNAPNVQIDSFTHLQRHWTIFIFFLIKIHGMCTPSGCRRWRKKEKKTRFWMVVSLLLFDIIFEEIWNVIFVPI